MSEKGLTCMFCKAENIRTSNELEKTSYCEAEGGTPLREITEAHMKYAEIKFKCDKCNATNVIKRIW